MDVKDQSSVIFSCPAFSMDAPLFPRFRAYLILCHGPALLVRALTTRQENLAIHADDWIRAA
jgi:hypothetical protein